MKAQKNWAWIAGIVLLIAGIWGFVSEPVFGLFAVNTLHNVVHLLTGLIFIWAAWKGPAMKVNQWLGVIYILVAIVGFLGWLTFLHVMGGNDPDNWLHLGLGVVSAAIGWKMKK